jgi:hypothetical protein
MAAEAKTNKSDKFGILSAILCIIHCTFLPLAFAFITTNIDIPFSQFSYLLDLGFIVISLAAVYFSARHSPSLAIKSTLWIFVTVFIAGIALEHITSWGKVIAFTGSIGLIVAHFYNLRYCRKGNHVV